MHAYVQPYSFARKKSINHLFIYLFVYLFNEKFHLKYTSRFYNTSPDRLICHFKSFEFILNETLVEYFTLSLTIFFFFFTK